MPNMAVEVSYECATSMSALFSLCSELRCYIRQLATHQMALFHLQPFKKLELHCLFVYHSYYIFTMSQDWDT